jgi:hypothetical protein
MDRLVAKSHLHCLKSHTMLSVNRLHPLRVHLKVTQVNKLSLSRNNSLERSPPHQTNSLRTTLRTPNAMPRITATINNSMACSKERRVSKTAQLSNDHSVDTMVLKLREFLNSPRAQLNKLHLATQLPVVKEAATTLPTQLPRLSSKELAKAHNLNSSLVTPNNLKLATTPMAIPTIRAHTMLHT